MSTSTTASARRGRRATAAVAVGAAALLVLTGCGDGDSLEDEGGDSGGDKGSLVIGAGDFTEGKVLAELYAQLLSDAGYQTSTKTAKRELYLPELEKGAVDIVPEYAATLAEFLNRKVNGPSAKPVASPDVQATVRELRTLADKAGLKVLEPGKAVDQNAFAVSKDYAKEHNLTTLSDLGKAKLKVKLAAGDECPDRPYCEPGLEKTYGIDITEVDPKGVGTVAAKQAVKTGSDQLVLTTTTDATLDQFGLVLLEDDKHLQNADNVVPVVNAKDAGSAEIAEVLNKLTEVLTTEDLTELNKKVDARREKPGDVAKEYLKSKGLI
ncbi:amino acid ABC transporter substrate-binding protein [Wenjunlia vitaminophila]|uniref:Amino acid ABC transporter substrate-binding protein n=1 Tax=Wenjunlia vitaminophila TaxID=76728 RepID=A0A0T6LSA9_WENVI|nr:ABC transporter substrate-binding protein [Wenjunlia vitaminophila]KRV48933.1 amino acid ABC transporter substrate-binding protein [Wenjunlia vitaminophila]